MFKVYIAPHERHEALEAYENRLTEAQVETIEDAPEEAGIWLYVSREKVEVGIVEETVGE